MAFSELPERSKMRIFASIVHHLCTNNDNVYVSKIYAGGFIYGDVYTRGGGEKG